MLRRLVAAIAALLLFAVSSPRAPGGSDEDGLNPPLDGVHDVSDPAGIVTLRLPAKIEPGGVDPNPILVAAWRVWLQPDNGPHLTVYVSRKSAFSRAALHASMTGNFRDGEVAEGAGPRGTTEWREVHKDKGTARSYRMFEHGGEVFEAVVSCTEQTAELCPKHIEVILSSFKGVGKPPPPVPPAGFKVFESGGREVWSNDKMKAEVDRALALHAETWERMKTLLPAQFADTAPARVFICKDAASYNEFAKGAIGGEPPAYGFVATNTRAVVIMPSAVKDSTEFERQVRRACAIQCARACFGGPTPYWLENGLAIESLFIAPKPLSEDKPNPTAVRDVKASLGKRKETLGELLNYVNAPAPADMLDIDHLVWAWHWYLRHGTDAGLDAKARYDKYMSIFVQSGDARAARAAWEGADFASLRTAFEKWIQSK